jgi:hypothetical protein
MTTLPENHPPVTDEQILNQLHGDICPRCGYHMLTPHSRAAKAGICEVCWRRAQNDALADKVALAEAERERDRLKTRLKRTRHHKSGGGRGG